MTLAYLFPGQGSQRPGMLRDLPEDIRAEAGGIEDTAEALRSSTTAQLALLAAGVAAARALTEDHGLPPDLVAGHSVGAFAAAVTAGVLTFGEAVEAVRLRGTLMEEACAGGDWGMLALRGVRLPAAERIVAASTGPLWIATVNAADQIVLSGTGAALTAVGQGHRLDVTVASHCPLQRDTADRLARHLGALPRREQTVPYLSCAGGRRIRADAAAVLDDLARSVALPVRWYDATRLLGELGTTCAIQLPPGDVLARLLPAAAPDVLALAADDGGLARTAARARRRLGSTVDGPPAAP
ncbi:MAG TPA: acyltransferase domain-containing protein [Mycobacteriales bacterium]|nr:acyltransferase domain-containing protein [Mycobacteriales bacterium]